MNKLDATKKLLVSSKYVLRKSLKENVLVFKQVEEKRDNYTGLCKALRRHFKMVPCPIYYN